MLTAKLVERDHLVCLSIFEQEISSLKSATEILYGLVHENGDESHLRWVTDKILNDVAELSRKFSEDFGVDIAKLRHIETEVLR
jgi:hypothetical protein